MRTASDDIKPYKLVLVYCFLLEDNVENLSQYGNDNAINRI